MEREFCTAYEEWLHNQLKERQGEARRRLEEGHSMAEWLFLEKVWWPAVGHFHGLIAEYELRDFRDGVRFVDFAYLVGGGAPKVCLEVDGFGPHWRDITRRQFADQWMRQNHLVLDGWKVLRFAYDDLNERPRQCQQIIHQLLGTVSAEAGGDGGSADMEMAPLEREILRYMRMRTMPLITPRIVRLEFGVSEDTAYRYLHKLMERGFIAPTAPGKTRIHKYILKRT